MEFFCRKMPEDRKFLVAAGITRVLEHLEHLSFDDANLINYMRNHAQLGPQMAKYPGFIKWLKELKTDKLIVHSMMDGDIFFPNEPILRVSGPTPILVMVETAICGILNNDVAIASRAARIRITAKNKELLEFGTRRGDPDTAPHAALAAFIGGFDKTSNCDAEKYYTVPAVGTMAHSWVQSYGCKDEFHAFKDFLMAFQGGTALLLDTYDIKSGVHNAMAASKYTKVPLTAVRLDSGDPEVTVPMVKAALLRKGFGYTKIVLSNDLNEHSIAKMSKSVFEAVDAFGIGSAIRGLPSLGFVGKIVETGYTASSGNDTIKMSADSGKTTWPGRKNVRRHFKRDEDGIYLMECDEITAWSVGHSYPSYTYKNELKADEGPKDSTQDMLSFRTIKDIKYDLTAISQRFRRNLVQLPAHLSSITPTTEEYPVTYSNELKSRREACMSDVTKAVEEYYRRYEL